MRQYKWITVVLLVILNSCATSEIKTSHVDPAWYLTQAKAIKDGDSNTNFKKAMGVFIFGFYNNENTQQFSPEFINYVTIDFNNTKNIVANALSEKGILNIPSSIIINELLGNNSDRSREQLRKVVTDSLPIINEYIQTDIFNDKKAVNLSFPSLAELSMSNLQWDSKFPIYVVVGLETQRHTNSEHVLSSALGIVRFSGDGKYNAMGIIPYDFSNINDKIFSDKIVSFIMSTENKRDSLKNIERNTTN